MPPSVDILVTTGALLTGGGVSIKHGCTLSLLVGEKARSLLIYSVGACLCTISTPGISTVAGVSGVCTPGRVSST